MSERRPGVTRLRHGAGVRVGHVCAEGTVHSPIVSRQPPACFPDPKFWQKRTQKLWYTAGWESRSVGWVTGVDARATGTRRLRGDDARASMPPHAHRGGVPVFLMQLSSTDDCTCPRAPRGHAGQAFSHTRLCSSHRACAAAAIGNDHPLCTMDAEKQEPQPGPLEACVPPAYHPQPQTMGAILHPCLFYKPWFVYGVQFAPLLQNHGLLHGVQIAYLLQNHGLLQGIQIAPRIQTMVL